MKFDQYWVVAKDQEPFITPDKNEAIARFNELWKKRTSPSEVVSVLGETPRGFMIDCYVTNGDLEPATQEI